MREGFGMILLRSKSGLRILKYYRNETEPSRRILQDGSRAADCFRLYVGDESL